MSTLLPTEIEESYNNKYKDLLSPENAYQFYLKVQFMIPKMAKKDEATYFYYISYAMKHLSSLNEKESSIALLDLSLANYVKFHNAPENVDTFIKTFNFFITLSPFIFLLIIMYANLQLIKKYLIFYFFIFMHFYFHHIH